MRRTHDGARGRDGPRVHRPPPRRAASRARRDPSPSPPDLATVLRATRRAVAAPCPALDNRPLYVQRPARAESRPPHAPAPDTAPPSCEPSPTTLAYSQPRETVPASARSAALPSAVRSRGDRASPRGHRGREREVLRLHHAEQWPVGTIAAELGRHHDAIERVLAQSGLPVCRRARLSSNGRSTRTRWTRPGRCVSPMDLALGIVGGLGARAKSITTGESLLQS